MILELPPSLIGAAFFCLATAVSGGARAAEVYPGCAIPPTTFNHIWYVDPVNGKTPADGGNGSPTTPWNSLQGVVSSKKQPGYNYPMLSTVTYDHYPQKNPQGARFGTDGPSGDPTRVQPGDEILLMGGQYGDISIGAWAAPTTNSAFVTIAAAPGQTPVFSSLGLLHHPTSCFQGSRFRASLMARRAARMLSLWSATRVPLCQARISFSRRCLSPRQTARPGGRKRSGWRGSASLGLTPGAAITEPTQLAFR